MEPSSKVYFSVSVFVIFLVLLLLLLLLLLLFFLPVLHALMNFHNFFFFFFLRTASDLLSLNTVVLYCPPGNVKYIYILFFFIFL